MQHEGRWPILCRAKVSPLPSLLCCNTRVRLSALCLRRDIVKRLWNQIKERRWRHQWQLDAANNKKKKRIKSFLGMSCVPLVLQSANANSSQEPVQYDSKHPDVPDVSVPERSPLKCPSSWLMIELWLLSHLWTKNSPFKSYVKLTSEGLIGMCAST